MAAAQASFPRIPTPDMPSPASAVSGSVDGSTDSSSQVLDHRTPDKKQDSQQPAPPKTDKPRPHVCQNCGRAFARLEHLKRHERSHTKEKPFECPECTRCFARRDLLLRHQQKLHFAPGQTKPRANRRESVSNMSTASGRVRKNSMAASNNGSNAVGYGGHRPRANTLGHLDLSSLNLFDRANLLGISEQHIIEHPHGGFPGHRDHHASVRNLPKLETSDLKSEMPMPLRTAPPYVAGDHFSPDQLFPPNTGTTVDPAQLHFDLSSDSPLSPFPNFPALEDPGLLDVQVSENDFAWMKAWQDSQMHVSPGAEFAVDESTPPSIPETTHASTENYMIPNGPIHTPNWNNNDFSTFSASNGLMTPAAFHMDSLGSGLPVLDQSVASLSPQTSYDTPSHDGFFNPNFQDSKNGMHGMQDLSKGYKSYDRDGYEVYYNRFGTCMAK